MWSWVIINYYVLIKCLIAVTAHIVLEVRSTRSLNSYNARYKKVVFSVMVLRTGYLAFYRLFLKTGKVCLTVAGISSFSTHNPIQHPRFKFSNLGDSCKDYGQFCEDGARTVAHKPFHTAQRVYVDGVSAVLVLRTGACTAIIVILQWRQWSKNYYLFVIGLFIINLRLTGLFVTSNVFRFRFRFEIIVIPLVLMIYI